MIVDDEPLILAGITSVLDWEKHHCKIVGKATNGQQAISQMEELNPDIVITDIKMPAMDGITYVKQARNLGDDVAFILLTNLEDFELAREAMKLGVVDYLVKLELTEKNLKESLERAKEYCHQKKKMNGIIDYEEEFYSDKEAAKNYFRNMLLDETSLNENEYFNEISEKYRELVTVLINFNYTYQDFSQDFTRKDQKKIMAFAENVMEEMVKGFFDTSCLIRQEQNRFLLILSVIEVKDYMKKIKKLGEKIISVLKDYFEVEVSLAVSQKGQNISEFSQLVYQVTTAMAQYYYDSANAIIFYTEEHELGVRHKNQFNISFMKKELGQMIAQNDYEGFKKLIDQIIGLFEEYKPPRLQAINACYNLYYFTSAFFEDEENATFPYAVNIISQLSQLNSLNAIISWISWFRDCVSDILKEKKGSRQEWMVLQVHNYIIEHYGEKITLAKVAEELKISQGYLSTAFKKYSGSGFSEYVAEIKVEKAKELISTHQYMMYEISDMLGFDTPYYFSTVFKKVTGYTPKEYEKNISVLKNYK